MMWRWVIMCAISVSFAMDGFDALRPEQQLFIEAQQTQSRLFQSQQAPSAIPAGASGLNGTGSMPGKMSYVGYLADKYFQKTLVYETKKGRPLKGVMMGIRVDKKKRLIADLDNGDKVHVQLVLIGEGTPSSRIRQGASGQNLEQQLQMQQMISQALSGIMSQSDSDSTPVFGDPTMLSPQDLSSIQNANQSGRPSVYRFIHTFLSDETMVYLDKRDRKVTGIPDYVAKDDVLILKDGLKLKPRFRKL